jgi:hypothetical protein
MSVRVWAGSGPYILIGTREYDMNCIKKNINVSIYLLALIVSITIASHVYAQDSASVNVIGLTQGSVEIDIKNISDNQSSSGGLITWSNVRAGETFWKIANQYIEISYSSLPEFWGIQIYTDNENISAEPRYTGTADPAGLVDISNTILSLPMAWRITDSLLGAEDLSSPTPRSDGFGFSDYMWHFLKDKNTPDNPNTTANEAFVDGEDYVTLWNQAGIAWNQDGRSGNPKKAYIYLAANFTMSPVGATYQTSALTIEAYEGISPFPIYLFKDASLTDYPNEPGATLENHFSPSGWMNSAGQFQVNSRSKSVPPYSGTHSFKIHWDGRAGSDGGKWGGIMWLEPDDIWDYTGNHPKYNGYDLRGADFLSFRARTNVANTGMQIKVFLGNHWDSCNQTPAIWREDLDTTWKHYSIDLSGRDMSNVTGGLAIVFDAAHDPAPDGCTIYLDDIKFDRY